MLTHIRSYQCKEIFKRQANSDEKKTLHTNVELRIPRVGEGCVGERVVQLLGKHSLNPVTRKSIG